ncbi:MAG: hypothetical protein Metus_0441 [Candidatus Methanosuratincola subterraneus]|uniref:Uncharacterized protein n=1 Tax=Methanosuratincola subterraneus TaxID=2593994 RepID=A0A3S3S0D2_METS7|nr:MAG: hypothetical protein Metus_0441 [Candidatus Methanosuratincola subterraneus]
MIGKGMRMERTETKRFILAGALITASFAYLLIRMVLG